MVGLQLRLSLLKELPRVVYTVVAADAALTLTIFATLTVAALAIWIPDPSPATVLLPAGFIVAASLGWSLESRSLGAGFDHRLVMLLRAAGALSGVLAILLFGLASKAVERDPQGLLQLTASRAVLKLIHSIALAVAIGYIGRFMIRIAGTSLGNQLAVFLGIVAFIAGSAKQIDASPLITALVAGAVITNMDSAGFRKFETFIYKAEHTFAILFGILAGVFLEPVYALAPLGLAAALILARALLKPVVFRRVAIASHDRSPEGDPLPADSVLYLAAGRQSPLMLALAVSLILIEPSDFHKELLALMVVVGIAAEYLPAVAGRRRTKERHDGEQDPEVTV